ncbi:MAG: nitroreductase family protein [Rikenellaceae bacterium]|nr:nitroreductase family protein [Rikenellaceae bacterium]
MKFNELVLKNRSYRRFSQEKKIEYNDLRELIELARITPSARNLQPLKYKIVNDDKMCGEIFSLLGWAGYLKDWDGPSEGDKPSAYIIMVIDKNITSSESQYDQGISAQTILLGATEKGFGGCMIGTFDKNKLSGICGLTDNFIPVLVIALGYPCENIVITEPDCGDIKYYRDHKGNHYVPKRKLEDIIL